MSHANTNSAGDATHQSLVAILVRHGVTEPVAGAVVALGETLRAQMLQEPDPDQQRAHSGALDAQTGLAQEPTR